MVSDPAHPSVVVSSVSSSFRKKPQPSKPSSLSNCSCIERVWFFAKNQTVRTSLIEPNLTKWGWNWHSVARKAWLSRFDTIRLIAPPYALNILEQNQLQRRKLSFRISDEQKGSVVPNPIFTNEGLSMREACKDGLQDIWWKLAIKRGIHDKSNAKMKRDTNLSQLFLPFYLMFPRTTAEQTKKVGRPNRHGAPNDVFWKNG